MSFLGDVGSLYMLFLITLLIVGLGMIGKGFIDYLIKKDQKKIGKSKGADKMQNMNWLKLSLYSLVGIIVSLLILSFVSSSGLAASENTASYSAGISGTMMGATTTQGLPGLSSISGMGTINLDSNTINNNFYQIQQQLNQMQYQMSQLQLMLQNMNGMQPSSSSGTSNSSSGSSMPMM